MATVSTYRKKSQREIQQDVNQIGTLLAAGMTDREIIERLKLKRTTYYIYRAKLYRQSGELFEKTNTDELVYQKDLLHERLTRLYRQAELDLVQQQQNQANDAMGYKDKASTLLAAQNIAINIFKLNHEGLRVLSTNGLDTNRYLRRASREVESGKQIRILPGYTPEGGTDPTLVRAEAAPSDKNQKPDESEIY